ncbi:MAG: ImmA/IrrE family metallo-endopeptidase [Aureliella sp.]
MMLVDLEAQGFDVPELSLQSIAAEAEAVLAEYEQMFGSRVEAPVEIEDIATCVLDLDVGFEDLQARFNDRVHGALWLQSRTIRIDEELNPARCPAMLPRYHFTLGHELGHWVLHRRYFIDDHGNPLVFREDESPEVICRANGPRPLIERQADTFAGCLLMPDRLLRKAYRELVGHEEPIDDKELNRRLPNPTLENCSFVDGDEERMLDPMKIHREAFCEPLALQFAVSKVAMRIQLETLGFFKE